MKNARRFYGLLFILLAASMLISACAGAPQKLAEVTTEAQEATQAPAQEEPAPAAEKVTLTVWDFGGTEFAWMDDIVIPAFTKLYPNIEIKHVGIPEEEIGLKVETAVAAGEPPDIAVYPSAHLAKAGHVLYLDDYMARDNLKASDYCGLFAGEDQLEGKTFALPIDTNVMLTMYNKDLFKAAGLEEPDPYGYYNYDDWLTWARAVNKPADTLEERVWGATFLWPPYNAMFHYQSDPYVLGNDGRSCVGTADAPQWMKVWKNLLTAWDEDLTTETAGAMLADVDQDMFNQGKLGMNWGSMGDALYAKSQGINVGLTGSIMVTEGWVNNVGGWTTSYGIMSATKHPDEAWEFLKFLSLESPKIIGFGTEGEGGGLFGLPCYNPLMKEERFVKMAEEEPIVAYSIKMSERQRARPHSPDLWTVTNPFFEAFRQMSEDRKPVEEAVKEAAVQCQELLDQSWVEFDALGK